MRFLDRLPTVISCCFCCFLRAGTIVIGLFSFIIGLIFAPNVNYSNGFFDMNYFLSNYSSATENSIQLTLGVVSIVLCVVSVLLLVGACCNMPILIEIYQYGAIVYSSTVIVLYFILGVFCFFINSNCMLAGGVLCVLIICTALMTAYFLIVTNSLRMSLKYIAGDDIIV